MTYQLKDFEGAVQVKDGVMLADGRNHWCIKGKVSILSAKEVLGFDVNSSDSNWLARIESSDGSRSVNIPGCKVQAVLQGSDLVEAGLYVYDMG